MTVSIQANRGYSKRNYAVLRGNPVFKKEGLIYAT